MSWIGPVSRNQVPGRPGTRGTRERQPTVRAAALKVDGARRIRLLIICALLTTLLTLMLGGRGAHAVVVELNLDELTLRADLILYGNVLTMKSAWNADRTMIYTQVVVIVTNQIKGRADAKEVVIQMPGGVVGDVGLAVSDTPEFAQGEEVVVFLEASHTANYEVSGWWQGKYHVERGWVHNRGMKYPVKLHDLINQVVGIMDAHSIPSSLEPDWEQNLPRPSATPPDFGGVSISNFVYNGLHWPDPNPMGEDYLVNTNIVDDDVTPSQALAAVQAAADTWNAVPTANFVFTYGGTSSATELSNPPNGSNEIFWNELGQTGTLAMTQWWYNPSTGIIVESDQVINDSYNWDVSGSPSGGEFDLESVVLHEFGHYLSLGHDPDPAAVMYYASSAGSVHRTLHQNDIDGISFIYPGTAPTSTPTATPTATSTPSPTPTATPTATSTPSPTPTATPTATATPTSTPCVLFGDFDGDGDVDVNDIMLVANCWQMTTEDPDCAPYDLDGDGTITVVDIMLVAAQWGETCP